MTRRYFDEWFSGWGCYGYDTYDEAEICAKRVREFMKEVKGIENIKVEVVQDGDKYRVHNTSSYLRP